MSRQPGLVLLLLLALSAIQLTLSSTPHSLNIVHDDISDNKLDSIEEADNTVHITSASGIKISTPKIKELPQIVETTSTTTGKKSIAISTTHKPLSDEILNDLIEASKHNEALADDLRHSKILPNPVKDEKKAAANKEEDDSYDESDDDDYYYDYNYDDGQIAETTKKSKSSTGKTINTTNNPKTKKDEKPIGQLKPIKGIEKASLKNELTLDKHNKDADDANNLNNNTDNADDEDDYDEEDDEEDDIADEEEVVFNENVPCPRDCVCARNINSYLVATCSRLDPGKQKFGSDITDLVVTDVGPKYPILLGPDFFTKIGLKHVSSIKIANCTIEYLHQSAFHGLDELYAVNLTNVGLAIINPDTFADNKKLRMLTITGNDLSVMSSVHYLLKSSSIEELDLSRNNLMELNPNAFSHLSNIVYINLSQNNLQKIPEKVFDHLETIEELDLSYNTLKTLPAGIFNRTALAILRLKGNQISGDLRFGTADLQQLDLSYNNIKQIHHGMFDKMEGLTNLILKGNVITKIQPDSFLTLKNLRNIDLSINELDQVSSLLFYKNSELDVIRLNDNPRLTQLPTDGFQSYNGYFTVYYLDISNCAIGALGHKTFSTMPRLATLKLAWNNINNLERDTFASLTMLNDLDLSNNLIVKMDELMFMRNNDLTKLNLAGNPIRKLSVRLFLPMDKLAELDVSECELHSLLTDNQYGVGRKYKFYDTLRSFNASANQIKKISSADIKNFKNLRTLDISHNPLKCNEEFQDFMNYVTSNTKLVSNRVPTLANLESATSFAEFQPQAGWTELAREVCKHHDTISKSTYKIDKRIEKVSEDLDDDSKNLMNIMEGNKFKKMQTILKDSRKSQVVIDNEGLLSGEDINDEDDLNHAAEDKGAAEDDDEENESDYDEDDEDEEDYGTFDKKKAEKIDLPKLNHNHIQDDVSKKDKTDEFLLNKFMLDRDDAEKDSSNEDTEEIIIERGRIYYSGYKFLIPVIIIVLCTLVILLTIAKLVAMVMRKRGERYRMALLAASNNSIVYQPLSEEIKKPLAKEPKQPKVHRYAPINQV